MRIAVLGAGYAGVALARRLERSLPESVDIVVVDEHGEHLVRHLLHRVVRRPETADEIVIDLDDVLDRASVVEARVADIHPDEGAVTLADGDRLEYDVGAVCLGARPNYYDLAGVGDHALTLHDLEDAQEIHASFPTQGRVVVGGAGLSGIQLSGELAALASERGADPDIVLLEQEDTVAPGFSHGFRDAVGQELAARGVTVQTGATVAAADADSVTLVDGEEIRYDQFVWTGGIRGIDGVVDDRPQVPSTLRWQGRTFLLGDAARVVDDEGQAVPPSARTAIGQAKVVARNVTHLVEYRQNGESFEPALDRYTAATGTWLVTVGDGAVAEVGSRVLRGRAAKALKTGVGARYFQSVGAVDEAVEMVREAIGG